MNIGDILTLKEDVLVAYDHSLSSTKLTKGDKFTLVAISPNNPNFIFVEKNNHQVILRTSNFK